MHRLDHPAWVIARCASGARIQLNDSTGRVRSIMSFISVALGEVIHNVDLLLHDVLPPVLADQPLDDYAAVVLLVVFGVTTLREASKAKDTVRREWGSRTLSLTRQGSTGGGAYARQRLIVMPAEPFGSERVWERSSLSVNQRHPRPSSTAKPKPVL
jgi:hypothetical protein